MPLCKDKGWWQVRGLAATLAGMLLLGLLPPGGAQAKFIASPPAPTDALAPVRPDPRRADQWFVNQRMTPDGTVPVYGYAEARRDARALAGGRFRAAAPASPGIPPATSTWTNLGPSPLANEWWTGGPVSGRVSYITLSGSAIYLAASGGGLWRSTDAGATWTPLTDNQPSLAMGAVSVDPTDPDIIYAGTGEFHNSADSFYGVGVLKTSDGGATWSVLGADVFAGKYISAIAISPADANVVLVAGSMGLYLSHDGGQTWSYQDLFAGASYAVSDLQQHPTDPAVLYAAVPGRGVLRSGDGGGSFTLLGGGLPDAARIGTTALAVAPSRPGTLYASIADRTSDYLLGLYRSTDDGTTWTRLSGVPDFLGTEFYYGYDGGAQGFYDNVIAVSPVDPDLIYAGGIGLTRSTDGGATWSADLAASLHIHVDFHAMSFDSAGNLYAGSDGGIWKIAPGGTATNLNNNLSITQFFPGISQLGNGELIYAGSQDNGVMAYKGSTTWEQMAAGDGGMTAVDPLDGTLFVELQQGYLWRLKAGDWSLVAPPFLKANWVAPYVLDPVDSNRLYFGGENVYRSTDARAATVTWSKVTNLSAGTVSAFAIAPGNPAVVYAGWSTGRLLFSRDGGDTWTDISPGPQRWITGITVSPTNPYAVYVTLSGYFFPQFEPAAPYVMMTANAADAMPAWLNLTGNLPQAPVNALVLNSGSLIVASDVGVFTSANGGQSWSVLGSDLPNVQVVDLKLTADGRLFAATHGRGLWQLAVGAAAAPPTKVTRISPGRGPRSGGTTVAVYGSGFGGLTAVTFGNRSASRFTYVSQTEISAISPPGGGVVDVQVTAAGATSPPNPDDRFTYSGAPVLGALAPAAGPVGVGVTIAGSGFGPPGGRVGFRQGDTERMAAISAWSDTSISATVPADLSDGAAAVVVHAAGGDSNAATFHVTLGPALTGLAPGAAQTGHAVTATGAGFGGPTGAVYFSQGSMLQSGNLVAWADGSVTALVPGGLAPGSTTVAVYSNAYGYGNALPFTVIGPPARISIQPQAGSVAAGDTLSVTGAVYDVLEVPVPGVAIDLLAGGGSLTPTAATTGVDGGYSATFTAPRSGGPVALTAQVHGTAVHSAVDVTVIPPVPGLLAPAPDTHTAATTVTFAGTAGAGAPIAPVLDGTVQAAGAVTAGGDGVFSFRLTLAEGAHQVAARDTAFGLTSPAIAVTVDITAPVVTAAGVSPADGSVTADVYVPFSLPVSDALTAVDAAGATLALQVTPAGGQVRTLTVPLTAAASGDGGRTVTLVGAPAEPLAGPESLAAVSAALTVADALGNSRTVAWGFTVDTRIPAVTATAGQTPNAGGWFNLPVRVTLGARQGGVAAAAAIWYALVTEGAPAPDPGVTPYTAYAAPFTVSDGRWELYAYATGSGNGLTGAPARIAAYRVDTVAPALHVTAPVHDTAAGSAAVSGSSESGATVTAIGPGGTATAIAGEDGAWSLVVPLLLGSNSISLRATDAAGNDSAVQTMIIYRNQVNVGGTGGGGSGTGGGGSGTGGGGSGTGGGGSGTGGGGSGTGGGGSGAGPALKATPRATLTRESAVAIDGIATPGATVSIAEGGVTLAELQADSSGAFHYTAPLHEGKNTFVITVRSSGFSAGQSVTITRDTVPPSLALSAPASPTAADSTELTVSSEPGAAVSVDGRPAGTVGGDGTLRLRLDLAPGENHFSVAATDAAGNCTTTALTITRPTAAPPAPPPPLPPPAPPAVPPALPPPVAPVVPPAPGAPPTDMEGHWAAAAVQTLLAAGIVSGFEDGTFRPDLPATRAQVVKLLLGALGVAPRLSGQQPFADVDPGEWYAGYIDQAYAIGLLQGSGGEARPAVPVTRQEAAALLVRAMQIAHLARLGTLPTSLPQFADQAAIAPWAQRAAGEAALYGLLHGYPDGTFGPDAPLTRAEAATFTARLLQLQQHSGLPPHP